MIALGLGLGAATTGRADAAGCVSGAAAGAVVGHYAGHHAVLGAISGCIAGHEIAKHQKKVQMQQMHDNAMSQQHWS